MNGLGKLLFIAGLVLIIVGSAIWRGRGLDRLGRLLRDISEQKDSSTFYFPIATCLLLSALLSFVLWLIGRR